MEFPGVGQHCSQNNCKQLDFLPMKCDACSNIFCKDHIQYTSHNCKDSYKKDNQVPVCPLCNKPIPLQKDEVPDIVVGRHIDSDCQSDPAKERRKVYTNKCSYKGCKQKEMIPVKCDRCHKNFCLRHRFEDDHKCQGFEETGQGMSRQGAAAIFRNLGKGTSTSTKTASQPRQPSQQPQHTAMTGLGADLNRERQQRQQQNQGRQLTQQQAQSGLSEEEAMARAIQLSLTETSQGSNTTTVNKPLSQEEEDQLLAQALAASEEEARRQALRQRSRQQTTTQETDKRSCEVS